MSKKKQNAAEVQNLHNLDKESEAATANVATAVAEHATSRSGRPQKAKTSKDMVRHA